MKGKLFATLTAAVCLATASLCTGCGDETSNSMENTTTTIPVATETTVSETTTLSETIATTTENIEETPIFKTIGEDTGSEFVRHCYIENLTGKDIVRMSIRYLDEEDYWDYIYEAGWWDAADVPFPDENLIDEGEVFEADETRVLYYDTEESFETCENPWYIIQITFDDGIVSIVWNNLLDSLCQKVEIGYQLRFESVRDCSDGIVFENVIMVDECADYFSETPICNAVENYTLYLWDRYIREMESEGAEEEITYYEYEDTPVEETPVENNSNSGNSVDDGCIGEDGIFNDDSSDSTAEDTVDDGCIGDDGLFNDDDSSVDDGCIGDDGLFN